MSSIFSIFDSFSVTILAEYVCDVLLILAIAEYILLILYPTTVIIIEKIIDIIVTEEDFSELKFSDRVSMTMACKMSIKGNDAITLPDMTYLLNKLIQTDNPYTCPHGRPTIIKYSKYDLEKMFKRALD